MSGTKIIQRIIQPPYNEEERAGGGATSGRTTRLLIVAITHGCCTAICRSTNRGTQPYE